MLSGTTPRPFRETTRLITTDETAEGHGAAPIVFGRRLAHSDTFKSLFREGMALVEATLQAVRLRLRPILMTSLAFMFGVLPLALSTGAGSGSRRAIGVGVLGGIATATVLGIFFVPLFFVAIRRFFAQRKKAPAAPVLSALPEA